MKKIFIILAIIFGGLANGFGQTSTTVKDTITQLLPSGSNLTAAALRSTLNKMVDYTAMKAGKPEVTVSDDGKIVKIKPINYVASTAPNPKVELYKPFVSTTLQSTNFTYQGKDINHIEVLIDLNGVGINSFVEVLDNIDHLHYMKVVYGYTNAAGKVIRYTPVFKGECDFYEDEHTVKAYVLDLGEPVTNRFVEVTLEFTLL